MTQGLLALDNDAGNIPPVLVRVAVPVPVYGHFDYLWPYDACPVIGTRVSVPFARRTLTGIVLECMASSDIPTARLRSVSAVHDTAPLLPAEMLSLLQWASAYYHHPLGEVFSAALPRLLRQGRAATLKKREWYRWVGSDTDWQSALSKAPVQRALAEHLIAMGNSPVPSESLAAISPSWRQSIRGLINRQWVCCESGLQLTHNQPDGAAPVLLDEQKQAVDAIAEGFGEATRFLLDGVTGSGKTEVYLQCIEKIRQRGLQCLVLVPEISLTPQLMQRFERRLSGCLVCLHSGLNDTQRMQNWLSAAQGHADVVVGTRSSVMVPLPRIGLIIIDEEHDSSLKQQDGFRYHARDMAIMRAQAVRCPVVMGSATPSFESLRNVELGRCRALRLTRRAGSARPPTLALLDIRRRALNEGMSDRLIHAIRIHLDQGGQALVFINRRGYAPTLLCEDCGAAAGCRRCDAHMTVHARHRCLRCHHCGAERPQPQVCEQCGSAALDHMGYGTERITSALEQIFPDVKIVRIDRDSTRRKGSLEHQLRMAESGEARILVGTQMLAKGHHFSGLSLVGILDADRGLFGTDFRSLEHMGQLILQVAGRAGRESDTGQVLIQTRNPDNPILQTLIRDGYPAFASIVMQERSRAQLPPYSFMALVRAEATDASHAQSFLKHVVGFLEQIPGVLPDILGPAPAPMERLAGQYRAQLLLQSSRRSVLRRCLNQLCAEIDHLPGSRRCRWSIDMDPVDLF